MSRDSCQLCHATSHYWGRERRKSDRILVAGLNRGNRCHDITSERLQRRALMPRLGLLAFQERQDFGLINSRECTRGQAGQ